MLDRMIAKDQQGGAPHAPVQSDASVRPSFCPAAALVPAYESSVSKRVASLLMDTPVTGDTWEQAFVGSPIGDSAAAAPQRCLSDIAARVIVSSWRRYQAMAILSQEHYSAAVNSSMGELVFAELQCAEDKARDIESLREIDMVT